MGYNTLHILAQPSRGSFQPPFLGEDVLNVLAQNAFSTANADTTLRIIFESAAAFFEHHGSNLKTCKDIIDLRYRTGDTAVSTTIALRLHSQALVMLRDHETKGFENLTTEFSRGTKYAIIRQKFCRAVTTRLNHNSNSKFEEHSMNDEVERSIKCEGAPTLDKLAAIANKYKAEQEILDSDVLLEIMCMIFLSYLYWKYHDCYYPEGSQRNLTNARPGLNTSWAA
ncbi:uncharacterized protein LMH87_007571 [Akanthomyces muscarius]|uniref:Uncharacterized protein n=1 Tax=Akanthomyces muscarius TaxID=2231603 RepID=A0A9W8QJE6_AKAMU|nr:uncharacterized protein LMH87_007571 [Akanthomyces muscarius]KAJ4161537.1 hypothetical protein LMH87_007571 [Akanthomyces muscarius]